jgi:hypothetical protein
MKISIKKSLQGLLFVPVLALAASAVVPVVQSDVAQAQVDKGLQGGLNDAKTTDSKITNKDLKTTIKDIINVLLYIIGVLSVIMIIYGGFRYVTSGGDSGGVSNAKNTILYAIIGLVVAALAYAIINFVLKDILDIQ